MSLLPNIFWSEQPQIENVGHKISVIGAGMVGMAVAVSLLGRGVTRNLALVDAIGDQVKGEVLDLQHSSLFLNSPRICGGNDFSATKGSKIVIITSSVQREPGETDQSYTQRNAEIISNVVSELVKYCPDVIILVVGNPHDAMAYVAWKTSGFPNTKVIGIGNVLDTQKFRLSLSRRFNINPDNIHASLIGQQGERSLANWSAINIGGMRLKELNAKMGTPDDPENWQQIYKDVYTCGRAIHELKGYANWGIGMSIAAIAHCIINNRLSIFPVSVNMKGKYGIDDDVFISVPAIIGINGITDIVQLNLNEAEVTDLQNYAKTFSAFQEGIKMKTKVVKCKCRRCV